MIDPSLAAEGLAGDASAARQSADCGTASPHTVIRWERWLSSGGRLPLSPYRNRLGANTRDYCHEDS